MTTSPVSSPIVLTARGRMVVRLMQMFAVMTLAILAVAAEAIYVFTGVSSFEHLMQMLSALITLSVFAAAIILDSKKFLFAALAIIGVTIIGSLGVYGAFG